MYKITYTSSNFNIFFRALLHLELEIPSVRSVEQKYGPFDKNTLHIAYIIVIRQKTTFPVYEKDVEYLPLPSSIVIIIIKCSFVLENCRSGWSVGKVRTTTTCATEILVLALVFTTGTRDRDRDWLHQKQQHQHKQKRIFSFCVIMSV